LVLVLLQTVVSVSKFSFFLSGFDLTVCEELLDIDDFVVSGLESRPNLCYPLFYLDELLLVLLPDLDQKGLMLLLHLSHLPPHLVLTFHDFCILSTLISLLLLLNDFSSITITTNLLIKFILVVPSLLVSISNLLMQSLNLQGLNSGLLFQTKGLLLVLVLLFVLDLNFELEVVDLVFEFADLLLVCVRKVLRLLVT
jgi:hypothetical protein